MLSHRPPNFW